MTAAANNIPHEIYYHIVTKPQATDELFKSLYTNPSETGRKHFLATNGHLKKYVRPGQLVIVTPPDAQQCTAYEADLSEAAAIVDQQMEELSEAEAVVLTKYYTLLNNITGYSGIGYGAAMTYFDQHKKQVEHLLKEIEKLYVTTYNKTGTLNNKSFFRHRQIMFQQLEIVLKTMVGKNRMGLDINGNNLKQSLGLSTKSILHQLKNQPKPITDVPGFVKQYGKVVKYGKTLKAGGYVGLGLDVGQSGLAIYEACTLGTEKQCTKSKFSEGGRIVGSVAGGAAGGALAAYGVCNAIFALPSGGTSLLWCGIVAGGLGGYAGGTVFGQVTQASGEAIYEKTFQY